MINFQFYISFPFLWKPSSYKDIFYKYWNISKNKTFEVQLSKTNRLIGIGLNCYQGSHAGFYFDMAIFPLSLDISFHDNRHWDYEKGTWEVDDDR